MMSPIRAALSLPLLLLLLSAFTTGTSADSVLSSLWSDYTTLPNACNTNFCSGLSNSYSGDGSKAKPALSGLASVRETVVHWQFRQWVHGFFFRWSH